MCSEGYGNWTVVCHNNVHNKTYHWLQPDMRKVLNLAFSLKMLRSGIVAIFAYSTKATIFLALLSMRIPTRGHVVSGLNVTSILTGGIIIGLLPSISTESLHFSAFH